jgi:hypothetical protein
MGIKRTKTELAIEEIVGRLDEAISLMTEKGASYSLADSEIIDYFQDRVYFRNQLACLIHSPADNFWRPSTQLRFIPYVITVSPGRIELRVDLGFFTYKGNNFE